MAEISQSNSREDIASFLATMLDEEFGLNDPVPGVDDPLFSLGLLDSVDVLGVVAAIEERFGIGISPMDVSMDRLDTIGMMTDFVERRL
jgi:acyl carrier protein